MASKKIEIRGLPEIWTEGKTDWKILKKAIQSLKPSLKIKFHETERNIGDEKLLRKLETFSERENSSPIIFVFDRDNPEMVSKVNDAAKGYKEWGNNVYSLVLPVPSHRPNHEKICIELLFRDEELHRKDSNNRSLFLTSDFHENSGKHIKDPLIHCTKTGYIKEHTEINKTRIIDGDVFDSRSVNIALSKSDFANNIYHGLEPFHNLDFHEFKPIFEIVEKIILENSRRVNLFYPDLDKHFEEIKNEDTAAQCETILKTFSNVTSLALQIFIISVVRFYETQIINEQNEYKKKVTPIKSIITDAFRQPTLKVLSELALKCYYLVDSIAPAKLRQIRDSLNNTILLDDIGRMWDDLDVLFPLEHGTQKQRQLIRKDFITQVLPDLSDKLSTNIEDIEKKITDTSHEINVEIWKKALSQLLEIFSSVFSLPVYFRSIKNFDPSNDEYTLNVKVFSNGIVSEYEEKSPKTSENYEIKATEIHLGEDVYIHTYPFILIRNDALFFYKRTLPTRYEYFSVVLNETHSEPTRAKFSSSIFKTGSEQGLFWTDVIPSKNPGNGITANIPEEGPGEFIGRRKNINRIKDEVLEIINVNGIVYGPGGIGKTALMIQLTKELYEEKKKDNIFFNNIIWVSAKRDYYDYIHGTVEIRSPQVVELRHILYAILRFFEIENIDEYNTDDLKELVLELLQENKVLLIVDNFETIEKKEQVLDFFDKRVKRELKKCPENFKVILTSREMIPSGYYQIELMGLDFTDSKKLMDSLYKKYKSSYELSSEQKEKLHQTVKGIPILLKHCYARIYEYNESFDSVIRDLPSVSSQLVQFSYKEILDRVQKEDERTGLKILFLLETVNRPLMIRQMSDILEISEYVLQNSLPNLLNFECIRRKTIDNQEMYFLNEEINLLTQSLIRDNRNLYRDIRNKYFINFTIDKQMAYSSEEENLIEIFDTYVKDGQLAKASDFIKEQLKKRPDSIILNYYYAKYMKDNRIDIPEAIKILEKLAETSGNHPSIIKLLLSCHTKTEIPNFEKTDNLVREVLSDMEGDLEAGITLDIARFYIRWAIYLKQKKGLDTLEDNQRISDYKEKSQKVVDLLQPIESKIGDPIWTEATSKFNKLEIYYLLSQAYYHLWDYDVAKKMIDKAIKSVGPNHPWKLTYENWRKRILETKDFYKNNPWAGRIKNN